MRHSQSHEWMERARRVIPGGVNSPVRAFSAVGGQPPVIASGSGSRIRDVDGNEYIDYVGSWGPLILGHSPKPVVESVAAALASGASFGAPTAAEVELAEMVREAVPSMERLRLVNSGTEATMSALRVARGFTGRSKIIKFEGCYHGHSDGLLVAAGSGAMTLGKPSSAGVPAGMVADTLVLPFNNADAVRACLQAHKGAVAAIIIEPIAGNMGVVPPAPGYLQTLRSLCDAHGTVLIFDEVMTGFRVGYGGAQALYGVKPDMTTLGKIIGGGLPVGAYGGREEIMRHVAPLGGVYQAGTLSGNPLAVAAGLAMLNELKRDGVYESLEAKASALASGLQAAFQIAGVSAFHTRVGSMLCSFFHSDEIVDYASAAQSDTKQFARFHAAMLAQGIYLAPSQFEAMFVSHAHTNEDIERTIHAARVALDSLS